MMRFGKKTVQGDDDGKGYIVSSAILLSWEIKILTL